MTKKRKSTKEKKSVHNSGECASGKMTLDSGQAFEYEKIRDAIIVEANKIICEEERMVKEKAMEQDHMTKLLVETLNALFTSAMVFLGVFSFTAIVSTFQAAFVSEREYEVILCAGCWGAYMVGIIALLVVNFLKRQGKIPNKGWSKIIAYIIMALILAPLSVALFLNKLLFTTMALTVVFLILFCFCYLAMKSLKNEKDRAYLVSYFSAITGIVALVVSAITLVVTRF